MAPPPSLLLLLVAIWSAAPAPALAQPRANVGCLFSARVCDNTEWCYDDYAFGKCLPQHGNIDKELFYRFELLRPALHALQREMERLFRLGYRWGHAYTQCVLQALLDDARTGLEQFDRSMCEPLADQDLEAALKAIEGDEQEQLAQRNLARVAFTPSASNPHAEFADEVYFPPLIADLDTHGTVGGAVDALEAPPRPVAVKRGVRKRRRLQAEPPPLLFAPYNTPDGFRHGQETRDARPPPTPALELSPLDSEVVVPEALLVREVYERALERQAELEAEQEAEARAQARALAQARAEEEAMLLRAPPPPPPPDALELLQALQPVDEVQRRTPEILQAQMQPPPPPPPPPEGRPLPEELERAAELLLLQGLQGLRGLQSEQPRVRYAPGPEEVAARSPAPGYSEGGLVFAPPPDEAAEEESAVAAAEAEAEAREEAEEEEGEALAAGLQRLLGEYGALGLGFQRHERLDVKKPGPPFATNNFAFRDRQESNQGGQLEEMQPFQQPRSDGGSATGSPEVEPPAGDPDADAPSVETRAAAGPAPATNDQPQEEPHEDPDDAHFTFELDKQPSDVDVEIHEGPGFRASEAASAPQAASLVLESPVERPPDADADAEAGADAELEGEGPDPFAQPAGPYDNVDTSYVYIKFKDRSIHSWQDGTQIVREVARLVRVEPGAFTHPRVDDNEVVFKVENNSRGLNASEVSQLIDGIKGKLRAKLGVEVTSAGVGNKTKMPPVLVARADAGRELYLAALWCGALLMVLLALAGLFIIRRHARARSKLRELGGAPDAEASKDYQDLCRVRMANKGSQEKPEPVHAGQGARIASLSRESEASNNSPSSRSSTSSWSEEPALTNMDISTGHMVLSYMEDHLKNKDRLDQEWVALCAYEAEPCSTSIAREPENTRKNRHTEFVPYDHSRVVLNDLANISGSDYINASTITDHDPRNPAYIATQGPLPHTAPDFWQMVWEQGSVVMVMLTRLTEAGTAMCDRYWPKEGSELYHIYEVHLVSEHIWCDDYLVRSFYLKNLKTGETRTVTQFHFVSWPDAGVPASTKALLEFRRKVNKSYRGRSCPIVVHCSDGVGRTGTYCLIDMVLNRMAKGAKEIDIAATLEHIRDQRPGMVQTKQQFEFCLMAVAEEVHAILKALPSQQKAEVQPPTIPPPIAVQPQQQQEEQNEQKLPKAAKEKSEYKEISDKDTKQLEKELKIESNPEVKEKD